MKKLLFLISVMLLIFASVVTADAAITYRFSDSASNPVNNVDVLSYVCNDNSCLSLTDFVSGNTGATNEFSINYPTIPVSPYYYANYYFAEGFLPWEARPTWRGDLVETVDYTFNKKAQCRALVDNIESVNEIAPNVPLTINTRAYIDADTRSAFSLTPEALPIIPAGYEDYFFAETLVTLTITNVQGQVVYTDTRNLNIMVDQVLPVNFVWIPTIDGSYYISIRSEVIDNQCSSTIPEFAEKDVRVLRTLPSNQYYTILNNLDLDDNPQMFIGQSNGETIIYNFDKISNYADDLGDYFPVETNLVTNLYDNNGDLISTSSEILSANPDALNFVTNSRAVIIPSSGQFSLELIGNAVESYGDYENIQDVIRVVFSVVPPSPNPEDENNAPVLYPISDKVTTEDSLLSFVVYAYDPDSDSLTYSVENLPTGAVFNPDTRVFTWIPLESDIGLYENIRFIVDDGELTDSETINILVTNELYITSTPTTTAAVNELYFYDVDATDFGTNVRYYLDYYPIGMIINPLTGLIEWTPTDNDVGMTDVQVRVSDGLTHDTQSYRITIVEDEDELGLPHKFTISSVLMNDWELSPGDYFDVYVKLTNRGYQDEDDLKVRVSLPELGIISPLYTEDLDSVENKWLIAELYVPNHTKVGEYIVKISVENDDYIDIYYTTINVV